MADYDVAIVGGGISGTMAAIAAARCGAKILLIEAYGFLGGMLTAAGVGPMMTFHAGDQQVIRGVTGELIDRLVDKDKSVGHIFDTTGFTYTVTPFDLEGMKRELETMVLESGGEILYHTMLAGAKTAGGEIKQITLCNKNGLSELAAKVFVDATGDADLSAMAGVECAKGRQTDGAAQPMTMKLRMTHVNIAEVKAYIKANPDEFPRLKGNTSIIDQAPRLSIGGFVNSVKAARARGEITFPREELLFFETSNPGEVIINTSRVIGFDSTDAWSYSRAEIEGRRQARELELFLKNRIQGFQKARMVCSGPAIGVRSSRQIKGLYTITAQDLLSCKKFADGIAHSGYPLDIHNPGGEGTQSIHLQAGQFYTIPYRSLVNGQINNLVTVGRPIAATFEAQSAIRLSPTAGAIGHAGGVAAALAVKDKVSTSEVNISELQNALKEQGAYLDI